MSRFSDQTNLSKIIKQKKQPEGHAPSGLKRELTRRSPRTAWRLRLDHLRKLIAYYRLLLRRQHLVALDDAIRRKVRRRSASLGAILLLQSPIDRPHQLLNRRRNRRVDASPLPRHRDRLQAGQSRFHRAPLIVFASLMTILVANVNFHSRHPIAESFQLPRHNGLNVSRQSSAAIDVVIGMNLNLHCHFPSLDGPDGSLPSMNINSVGDSS